MRLIAIDPGLYASAVFYCPEASIQSGMRWQFFDVPLRTGEKRIDVKAFRDWIMRFSPDRAYVELVGPMPKQGIGSTSVFMRAAGAIEATVICCDVPYTPIAPQRWKRYHNLPAGSDKEASRQLALNLVPELAPMLARKKDHGRAEAALLALYGAYLMAPFTD